MIKPLLLVKNLSAGYGTVEVLHGLSLAVGRGEIVALVGANGAGKSTLLNTISGFVKARSGEINFNAQPIVGQRPASISRAGLSHVPEGRRVFAELSADDNLHLGGYGRPRAQVEERLQRMRHLFPRLAERRWQAAGTMSGGEQQMLAIGRAIASGPSLLMMDEPSMGLAPLVVAEVFRLIGRLRDEFGMGILLVEQNARAALRIADRAYVLSLGRVELEGTGTELLNDPAVTEAFLGGASHVSPLRRPQARLMLKDQQQ